MAVLGWLRLVTSHWLLIRRKTPVRLRRGSHRNGHPLTPQVLLSEHGHPRFRGAAPTVWLSGKMTNLSPGSERIVFFVHGHSSIKTDTLALALLHCGVRYPAVLK